MYCRKCGAKVNEQDRFCSCCGCEINKSKTSPKSKPSRKPQTSPALRRWEQVQNTNVSFDAVERWLNENPNIEIVSVRGNMQYNEYGSTIVWHFTFISIRYYPNVTGHRYAAAWGSATDTPHLFRKDEWGRDTVDKMMGLQTRYSRKTVFHRYQHAHFSGGGNFEHHCAFEIFEF